MTKKTKRRRSKKRRPDFFQKNKFLLVLMGLTGIAIVGLVLLARVEEAPPEPELPPIVKPKVDYTRQVHAEIEGLLSELDLDSDHIQRDLGDDPARYIIESDLLPSTLIADLQARLLGIPDGYTVSLIERNSLAVERDGKQQVVLQFVLPVVAIPAGPLLTIIMDDLGRSTYAAERLLSMAQPVSFSILPGEPQAVRVAEMAHAAGREVMLHVPMEPQGYPAVNPGPEALFVKDSDAEIRNRFDKSLAKIPHLSGANNHMGSRFTEDARALAPVMASLREKDLFFIDSRTTGQSLVSEVAHQYGVPTMARDVFLDNVAEVEAISREIRRLEGKAHRQGMAIGICHPYPETLEALRKELPGLVARGVTIVPVSVLLKRQALSQGS